MTIIDPQHKMLKSHRSEMGVIYAIIKTMYLLGYHHNGFVGAYALGHMNYAFITHDLAIRSLLGLLNALWFIATSNV